MPAGRAQRRHCRSSCNQSLWNSEFPHVRVHTLKLSACILGGARGRQLWLARLFGGNRPRLNSCAPALGASISLLVASETETTAAAESPFKPQPGSRTKGSIFVFSLFYRPLNSEPRRSLHGAEMTLRARQLSCTGRVWIFEPQHSWEAAETPYTGNDCGVHFISD